MKTVVYVMILACLALGSVVSGGEPFLRIDEERFFAVEFEPPQIIRNGDNITIIPATPIFEKRTIGVELRIIRADVKQFMLVIDPQPVAKATKILDRKKREIDVGKHKYAVLNRELFRVLGQKQGYVFFKHLKTRKVAAAPIAGAKTDPVFYAENAEADED